MSMQRNRANIGCALLVAAFSFVLTACSEKPEPTDGSDAPTSQASEPAVKSTEVPPADAALLARGVAAFERGMCVKCHLEGGIGGKRAPDLTDDKWLHCDGSIAGIRKVLDSGVPRDKLKDSTRPFAMNPVTNLVPDSDDLDALAAYVFSLSH